MKTIWMCEAEKNYRWMGVTVRIIDLYHGDNGLNMASIQPLNFWPDYFNDYANKTNVPFNLLKKL